MQKKPIREIRIGDLVLAYNEVSGENGYYPVTDTISHQDPAVVELTIDHETLTTTQEHPFYTLEKGWQAVDELTIGEHIRQADGDYGTVEKIEVVQLPRWMYNLTVDQAHTFYVGDQEWLVHNSCGSNALRRAMGLTDPEMDAHHLIPQAFKNHPLVMLAKRAGWRMNSIYNGIALPKGIHAEIPGHPGYNSYVGETLDQYYNLAVKNQWTSDMANLALRQLDDFLRIRINNSIRGY